MSTGSRRTPSVPGAQAISRAAAVLAVLGADGGTPKRAVHVARIVGVSAPTAARLLAALAATGLAERAPESKLWRIGPEADALAAARGLLPARFWLEVEGALYRIVEAFGLSASFWLASGDERVCMRRIDGALAPGWAADRIGDRLAVSEGAGGAALLALDAEAEVRAALARIPGLSPRAVRAIVTRVTAARTAGIADDERRSADGYTALAIGVRGAVSSAPLGALVLTQQRSSLGTARRDRIRETLVAEAERIAYASRRPYEASLR